jgi:RND family efflux transporter MFP subunit
VAHTLWLLVLLKLLTPSMVGISLPERSERASDKVARDEPPITGAQASLLPLSPAFTDGAKALNRSPRGRDQDPNRSVAVPSAEGHLLAKQIARREPSQTPGERHGGRASLPASTQRFPVAQFFRWKEVAIGLWLVGAVGCWSIVALQAHRFRRLLRCVREAPADLKSRVTAAARRLGLKHVPEAAIVPARLSPMIWAALTGRPRLLVPEELWARLDSAQKDAVLTHELAHLKRRDHWVRRVETVVLGLYWWFPVVWWTRRELERTEEACCDAWVLWAMPDGADAYADALVATAAFLSGHRQIVPPGAIAACRTLAIQERLNMILDAAPPYSLARKAPLALLVLGMLSLPVLPGLATSQAPAAPPQKAAASAPPAIQNDGAQGEVKKQAANDRPSVPSNVTTSAGHPAVPTVRVCRATEEEVSARISLAGTLQAPTTVNLQARASGYIVSVHFSPGDIVKLGDLLFTIDSRSYRAELDVAEAQVARAQAHLRRRAQTTAYTKQLNEKSVVSQQEVALHQGEEDEAKAELQAATAARDLARLNLDYTNVRAPLAGKISSPRVSTGGLAVADKTDLAVITSTDPLYASFYVSEQTYLELARWKHEGKMKMGIEAGMPVEVKLLGALATFRKGKIQFVDSRMTPTGIACLASVSNSDGLLLPGMSARVSLQSGPTHRAVLLPDSAWIRDRQVGGKVLVVTAQNVVEARVITVDCQEDGAFALAGGVKVGELVVLEKGSVEVGQHVVPQIVDWHRPVSPVQSDNPPH